MEITIYIFAEYKDKNSKQEKKLKETTFKLFP